jgi:Glycosyl-transferase for dystroglycan
MKKKLSPAAKTSSVQSCHAICPVANTVSYEWTCHRFFAAALGVIAGLIVAFWIPPSLLGDVRRSSSSGSQPSYEYSPIPHAECSPLPYVREYHGGTRASSRCTRFVSITPSSVHAIVHLTDLNSAGTEAESYEISVAPSGRISGEPRGRHTFQVDENAVAIEYIARGLEPDADYVLVSALLGVAGGPRRSAFCRASFSTFSARQDENLVRNGGFEIRGDTPYVATRFHVSDGMGAKSWTPFYNGGCRVFCGFAGNVEDGSDKLVQPRSGRCCLQLGPGSLDADLDDGDSTSMNDKVQSFYGAYQAVSVPKGISVVQMVAWYRLLPETPLDPSQNMESPRDSLSMSVGWQLDDGSVVDPVVYDLAAELIRESDRTEKKQVWRRLCATIRSVEQGRSLRMIHLYFQFHDRSHGALLVDDVSVVPLPMDHVTNESCYSHRLYETAQHRQDHAALELPRRHLAAQTRPLQKQLTIAVPLTGDRVLRLEAMSRLYGGGPIVAAVLVRDEEEASTFVHIWRLKPWLYNHVDVTLVYMSRLRVTDELIPINALRNVAVRLAETDYTLMLDVDMTPATETFACFRDPNGRFLSGLIRPDGSRIFTLPVFITDVHARPPRSKGELLNMVFHRVATTYCFNSQKAAKIERWYAANAPYETRFQTDYEPYGICARYSHPGYDERFVGYGFNKISWAWGAEASGARFFVLSDSFLVHLNHVDNDWVTNIAVPKYLRTWRRYFAFVAETVASHGAPLPPTYISPMPRTYTR